MSTVTGDVIEDPAEGPSGEEPVSRVLPSGDEAGTAPGDRRFRPEVEGLRAMAVVHVVHYHASFT